MFLALRFRGAFVAELALRFLLVLEPGAPHEQPVFGSRHDTAPGVASSATAEDAPGDAKFIGFVVSTDPAACTTVLDQTEDDSLCGAPIVRQREEYLEGRREEEYVSTVAIDTAHC